MTTGNLVARGTLAGGVGQALNVSIAMLDPLGKVVPNPNEWLSPVYVLNVTLKSVSEATVEGYTAYHVRHFEKRNEASHAQLRRHTRR